MKENFLKTIVVVLVILALTISDFLILGVNIAYALDGLEDQETSINSQIDFDAYFKEGENKIHSLQKNISEEVHLYLNVKVKDSGALSDLKIQLENANFDIGDVQSDGIKNIDKNSKTIELNPVRYGTDLEIDIPIKFKKESKIDQDYFSRETNIKIIANALEKNGNIVPASKEIRVKMNWTEQTDIQLSSEIEKYILLEENKSILQQKIITKVNNNSLPKQNEVIQINVPEISQSIPSKITVIKNGNKLSEGVEYNEQDKKLTITNTNNPNEENKIIWANKEDEYKVVYTYDKPLVQEKIQMNTQTSTKLYTQQDNIVKEDNQEIELSEKGHIASIKTNSTEKIYKGYLYANKGNETTYDQKYTIEISDKDTIDEIEITSEGDEYITSDERELSTNDATYFKEILFNKNNMTKILGEDGNITIYDEDGTQIAQINKDTQDDNGNISVKKTDENGNKVDLNIKQIKIVTTKPETEGNLEIIVKKAINSNTGYDKQTLKTVNRIESSIKVKTLKNEAMKTKDIAQNEDKTQNETTKIENGEEIAKTTTNLEDTITKAKLEINNNNLSTLQENKGIQITATLLSNSNKYDLYKNPSIQIILPKEIENLKINPSNVLFNDGFKIVNQTMEETPEGNKVLKVQFEGEQENFENDVTEGMQIVISSDITIKKLTPNMQTQIKMIYTNENGNENQYEENLDVNINSKPGVLTYSKVTGFNEENTELETMSDKIPSANLDMNSEEKVATVNMAVINNYESEISNVSIIGNVPANTQEKVGDNMLKGTFDANIVEAVTTSVEGAKVYYSEDAKAEANSESWKETSENAKAYKITLPNNEIKNGEKIEFGYKFAIPENLSYNESNYTNFKIDYEYAGHKTSTNSATILETEKKSISNASPVTTSNIDDSTVQTVEIADGIIANIVAKSAGKYLKNGDEVVQGQTILYSVTVNNNTQEDIKNLKLVAQKPEYANFLGEVKIKAEPATFGSEYNTYIKELPNQHEYEKTIETLEAGSNVEFKYEVVIIDGKEQEITLNFNIEAEELSKKNFTSISNTIKEGKLKTLLELNQPDEVTLLSDTYMAVRANITNISNKAQSNITVKMQIPDFSRIDESEILTEIEDDDKYKLESYDADAHIVTFKITDIQIDETINIGFIIYFTGINTNLLEEHVSIHYTAQIENDKNEYTSNELLNTVEQNSTKIEINQTANVQEGKILENGEKVIFTANISNLGALDANLTIADSLPYGLNINRAYYIKNGETNDIEVEYNQIIFRTILNSQETMQVVVECMVDAIDLAENTVTSKFTASGVGVYAESNEITFTIKVIKTNPDEGEGNVDPDDGNKDDDKDPTLPEDPDHNNPSDDRNDVKENITIAGKVWNDKNKNGKMDENESGINNIKVLLIDAKTGNYIKTRDGNNVEIKTNTEGNYEITNIAKDKYYVVFEYNESKYRVTDYKKIGVNNEQNSKAISKQVTYGDQTKTVAITDVLDATNGNIQNVNLGLIEKEIFDIKLDKYVNKITIQNKQGTVVKQYSNTQLAKVELDQKYLSNSTVLIEYEIKITNEGEIDGYVGEIIDYIPKDLQFNSQINKDWYLSTDGNLHNATLANEIIAPKETKTKTLTLTKTMTNNNTGTIINTAEIAKCNNQLGISDKDSTPGNKQQGEDDMSTAEVIISIKTGATVIGIIFVTILLGIILAILIIIKKRKEVGNE